MKNLKEMVDISACVLGEKGFKVTRAALEEAKTVMPRCRLESIPHKFKHICDKVWLDVGHNPDAINQVLTTLSQTCSKISIIYGGKPNKDIQGIFQIFKAHSSLIHSLNLVPLQPHTPSDLQSLLLSSSLLPSLITPPSISDINDHLHSIFDQPTASIDGLLIIGSFSLMADAHRFFDIHLTTDDIDMNDTYRFK